MNKKHKELDLEELRELSNSVINDPNVVHTLTDNEAMQLRKYINPLGNIVTNKRIHVNMSLVNWKDKYLRKLHLTTMIGYLYRTLEEYEPTEELEREKRRYAAALATAADKDSLLAEHKDRLKLISSTAHGIIEKFLNRNFEYNPDLHLRGSKTSAKNDPERAEKYEQISKKIMSANESTSTSPDTIEEKLKSKPDAMYKYMRGNLLTTYQTAVESRECLAGAIKVLSDKSLSNDEKQGILLKKYQLMSDIANDMKKIAEPLATADTAAAFTTNPPTELLYNIDRYLTNHYEQLRDIVTALYHEKSDLEYAVMIYDVHKTAEEAHNYRVQHKDEFRTEVFSVDNSGVSLIGPFKENRERVEYYNKNTEVLRMMNSQVEADHKLGKDLMEKKVRAEKKKNIEEAGPDHPALAAYAKVNNIVQVMGGKKILSREDQEKLAAAKREADEIKQDYEIPDDAIQVDMFFPKTDTDGNTTLEKSHFYTAAEPPVFLEEGSTYTNRYLPVRDPDQTLVSSYITKTITTGDGKKMTIQVPIDADGKELV